MTKPVEYRLTVPGFGTWRIAYTPAARRWVLAYSVRTIGEQWVPSGEFLLPESAAIAVAERKTGAGLWDGLRFPPPSVELRHWTTDASEGVQLDATN